VQTQALVIGFLLPVVSFPGALASAAGAIRQAHDAPQCLIEGTVGSKAQPLPGVVSLPWWTGVTSSPHRPMLWGNYLVRTSAGRRYTVRAELAAFGPSR
jgi:hypothetical protein